MIKRIFILCAVIAVVLWQIPSRLDSQIMQQGIASGSGTLFASVQGKVSSVVVSGTTVAVTLTSAPKAGDAVICAIVFYPGSLTLAVADNAGTPNVYTKSVHSPSNTNVGARAVSLAYLLNAPAGAGSTITATFSGGAISYNTNIRCNEYSRSTGVWSYDKDGVDGAISGTANLPAITPATPPEFLYGAVTSSSLEAILSANAPWTQDAAGIEPANQRDDGEYILASPAGATTLNFTMGGSDAIWNSIALALK